MRNVVKNVQNSFWFRAVLCIIIPMLLFGILLTSKGNNAFSVYATMFTAIFGSAYGIGEVVVRAAPLIMTSITSILPARVGLANAGGEGQLACGALATAFLGSSVIVSFPGYMGIPILLVGGTLFGVFWSGIAILLKMKLRMNETLMTILMNYVMTYIVAAMIYGPLKDPNGFGYPQTAEVAEQFRLKMLFGTRANIGIIIAIVISFCTWFIIYYTKIGFKIRAIGGNVTAAKYAGIRTEKYQFFSFLIAGAIAGLAGALLIIGVEGRMKAGTGASLGFMGFLAAGIVKNNPLLAILASFLIAMIQVMGNSMEINTGLPSASIQILLTSVLLCMMVVGSKGVKSNE